MNEKMVENSLAQDPKALNRLIDGLLQEPFAQENDFANLNLEKISALLEDASPMFESTEVVPSEIQSQKDSYERCKNAYCLLLLHLEGFEKLPTAPLGEMRRASEPPPERPMSSAPVGGVTLDLPLFDEPAAFPSLVLDETPGDVTRAGPPPEWNPADLAPLDMAPAPGDSTRVGPPPQWNPAEEEPHAALRTPIPKSQYIPDPNLGETSDFFPPLEGLPISPTLAVPTEQEFGCTSPIAAEYLNLAHYFHDLPEGPPFGAGQTERLMMFSLCFAVEAECIEKFGPVIPDFWPRREDAIRALLDNGNRRFDLHPILKNALDELAAKNQSWLYDEQFPHAGVLNSLRYMMATNTPDSFKPNAIESATLLLFFGHSHALGGFPLSNLLSATGLQAPELMELVFRLCRIQKFKNRV